MSDASSSEHRTLPADEAARLQDGGPLAGHARRIRCPHCHNPIQLIDDKSDDVLCPGCGSSFTVRDARHTDTTTRSRPLGKYQSLGRVGIGAFGAVWKARDTELDRNVALKIPHTGLLTNDTELQRFHREARAAAQLRHPGIVPVHSVETLEGLPTIVSDFIAGVPLRDLLEVRRLTFHEAATLIADVAEAVHYAHTLKVIHRDLKPANIMVECDDQLSGGRKPPEPSSLRGLVPRAQNLRPLVMDFGLALRGEAEVTMTMDGHIIGTPAYMSPEQAAGKGHEADARSDVYSLGVIFYELLTGELPFRGSRVMMIHQVRHEEPRPPRKVKDRVLRDLETVCLKCLRKEPDRRYQTAREQAEDLRRWQKGEPITARPVGRVERGWRWCRRNPALAGMAAAVALTVLGGTFVASYFAVREAGRAKEALEARDISNRLRYDSDMRLAQQAWESNRIELVRELLTRNDPKTSGGEDLRGFEWYYWQRNLDSGLIKLNEDVGTHVSWHPDSNRIATASKDGAARVWDMTTGQALLTLPGFNHLVAFSPDGLRLATAPSADYVGTATHLWDVATGRQIITLTGHTEIVRNIAFSPDGRRLATVSLDKTGRVWDTATGQELHTLTGHTDGVQHVAFSPDGNRIATASSDQTVRLWDASTGKRMRSLNFRSKEITQLAFISSGRHLATSFFDGTVRLWDATTGKEVPISLGHAGSIRAMAISPDGRHISTASDDQTARIWDASTGRELFVLQGHTKGIAAIKYSPDGHRLATASLGGMGQVWDALSGQHLASLHGHTGSIRALTFSSDGRRLATTASDKSVRVWDATGNKTQLIPDRDKQIVCAVTFNSDGLRLATSTIRDNGNTVRVWDVASKKEILNVKAGASTAAFSADGGKVAIIPIGDSVVQVWDLKSLSQIGTLQNRNIHRSAFSPDGTQLAIAGDDHRDHMVRVWDVVTCKHLFTLSGHESIVDYMNYSPDGTRLATLARNVNDPSSLRLWDTRTGQVVLTLRNQPYGIVGGVVFSPDGRRLVTSSPPRIWDAATGATLVTFQQPFRLATFSPDGRRLAVTSEDHTVKILDAITGNELSALKGHVDRVTHVAFNADGDRLATCSADKTIRVWDVKPGQELIRLIGEDAVLYVQFSTDGRHVAAAWAWGARIW